MDQQPQSSESPTAIDAEPSMVKKAHWRHLHNFKSWYAGHKKWSIPATVILLVLILAGIPWSRYQAAGLVLKKNFTVQVSDATAQTPVSGALVELGGVSATTNGSGKATLKNVKVGSHNLTITKKYYKDQTVKLLVPILSQKNTPDIAFTATGRQVLIKITNLINGKVLADVNISVAGTNSKTDSSGQATIVLPATASSQNAKLSLNGYNGEDVTVKVSNQKIEENDFKLTPTGKIYFLSKLSGKIDVVKTNLDGTERQTVLAGTGNEDDQNTVLLASRDWKYLALLSRRAGNFATLYMIDTANDQLSTIDEGSASFTPVGWSNSDFIYTVSRPDVQNWQPHRQALKSFNATSKQLLTLDQTGGQGTDNYNYAQESYGSVYLIQSTVVYDKSWNNYYAYLNGDPVNGKIFSGIYSINDDGSNAQTLKTFNNNLGWYLSIDSVQSDASQIYYEVNDPYQQSLGNNGTTHYTYANGKLSSSNFSSDQFSHYYQDQYTYLLSPSGNQTFWAEPRDGKNTLFIGDQDGTNGKQIATLSDYNPYGWYSDNYLLVQKDNDELYIMAKDDSQPAVKISDYHKPAQTFYGYGGGYGGL